MDGWQMDRWVDGWLDGFVDGCVSEWMLPDLHTGFSRGRPGGLVFPSLSEFSTVYCDPHSQRLWHSQ